MFTAFDLANRRAIAIPKSAQLLLSPLERAGTIEQNGTGLIRRISGG
jgi:hypothetical protein